MFAKNAFNSEKLKFDIKSDRFTKNFPSRDIYLSSKKLLNCWHFVSSRAPIPRSDMIFKKITTSETKNLSGTKQFSIDI